MSEILIGSNPDDVNATTTLPQTAEDKAKFTQKTKAIVAQFNKFEQLKGKFVNGDATQGENIADLGGVVMGYEAFKKTAQYKNNEKSNRNFGHRPNRSSLSSATGRQSHSGDI